MDIHNRIINAYTRCGRIANPTEREIANPTEREEDEIQKAREDLK